MAFVCGGCAGGCGFGWLVCDGLSVVLCAGWLG
jgi:hypothetical protein